MLLLQLPSNMWLSTKERFAFNNQGTWGTRCWVSSKDVFFYLSHIQEWVNLEGKSIYPFLVELPYQIKSLHLGCQGNLLLTVVTVPTQFPDQGSKKFSPVVWDK